MGPPDVRRESRIDPSLPGISAPRDRSNDLGYKEALKAWSRFRFVRAGWFTAAEAVEYIE